MIGAGTTLGYLRILYLAVPTNDACALIPWTTGPYHNSLVACIAVLWFGNAAKCAGKLKYLSGGGSKWPKTVRSGPLCVASVFGGRPIVEPNGRRLPQPSDTEVAQNGTEWDRNKKLSLWERWQA